MLLHFFDPEVFFRLEFELGFVGGLERRLGAGLFFKSGEFRNCSAYSAKISNILWVVCSSSCGFCCGFEMGEALGACVVMVVLMVLVLVHLTAAFGNAFPPVAFVVGAGVTQGLELLCEVTLSAGEATAWRLQ